MRRWLNTGIASPGPQLHILRARVSRSSSSQGHAVTSTSAHHSSGSLRSSCLPQIRGFSSDGHCMLNANDPDQNGGGGGNTYAGSFSRNLNSNANTSSGPNEQPQQRRAAPIRFSYTNDHQTSRGGDYYQRRPRQWDGNDNRRQQSNPRSNWQSPNFIPFSPRPQNSYPHAPPLHETAPRVDTPRDPEVRRPPFVSTASPASSPQHAVRPPPNSESTPHTTSPTSNQASSPSPSPPPSSSASSSPSPFPAPPKPAPPFSKNPGAGAPGRSSLFGSSGFQPGSFFSFRKPQKKEAPKPEEAQTTEKEAPSPEKTAENTTATTPSSKPLEQSQDEESRIAAQVESTTKADFAPTDESHVEKAPNPERKGPDLSQKPTDPMKALEWELAQLEVADENETKRLASEIDDVNRQRVRKRGKKSDDELDVFEAGSRERNYEYEQYKREQKKKEKNAKKNNKDTTTATTTTTTTTTTKEESDRAVNQALFGQAELTPIILPEFISVNNLANALGVRPSDFVRSLEDFGFEDVNYSHVLDRETSSLIAAEFGFEAVNGTSTETQAEDLFPAPPPEDKSSLPPRPPIITIMGHVDHGKTTILDWLRKSSTVASEHGGITQHIGAFSVTMPSGKMITFLDTPGHAAFLDMRRRGASVTDIVILVVSADDSVMPQTVEAIKHAKEAGVSIIVAVNKIDKPGADPSRVSRDLIQHDVIVEDEGGDIQCVNVSGVTGRGMLELEEAAVTLSEMLDHRAERTGSVEGWLIESTMRKGGRVATVLVTRGTLKTGDILVAGNTWTKVRSLKNEGDQFVDEAGPGTPVVVDGWRESPMAGDLVLQAETEQRAKDVVEVRLSKEEMKRLGKDVNAINEARRVEQEKRRLEAAAAAASEAAEEGGDVKPDVSAANASAGPKPIPFIVKADVSGSVEAVVNSLQAIGNSEIYAHVLRSGVGSVTESDIVHAAAAKAHIMCFHVPVEPSMLRLAEFHEVPILTHNVIYKAMDEVKERLSDHLPPNVIRKTVGEAELLQLFEITLKGKGGKNKGLIAGSRIRNGTIHRGHKVKVLRGEEVIYDGTIASLKNVKADVTEMHKGNECGIGFENLKVALKPGDQIRTYDETHEKRTL